MKPVWRGLPDGCRFWVALIALSAATLLWAAPAQAQIGRDTIPSTAYFSAFGEYYDGNYKIALDVFNAEAKSGIRTVESKWIDSICYYTMAGECYYQLGDLDRALEQYSAALKLFNSYFDWMMRVQFPANIRSAGPAARIAVPWGRSTRRSNIGSFPETMSMSQGRVDNTGVARSGGVVQMPLLFPVRVTEILRCTTLSIRRRQEILGPICKHDPLTSQLVASLSRRSAPPNHWSSAWVDVQLGLAFNAAGETARAVTTLERSIMVAGEFDHPLTCIALLELGKIALESGDFNAAARFFEEATYSATNFSDGGVLEEAFRYGQLTHLVSGQKGVYPPLAAATAWAKTKNYRQLHASLALLACENLTVQGDGRTAATMLAEAKTSIRGGDMARSWIGAKANLLTALLSYDAGRVPAGDQALAAALEYQKFGSMWLYQIRYADRLIGSNGTFITPRIGLTLYDNLLRDPVAADWARKPLDALAVLAVPHGEAYEHWFELAMVQGNRELALEISDRVRRHRFYSTLPMGGRLLSLRWVLEGPDERLTNEAKLQRQDLLTRYPKYQQLAEESRQIQNALGAPVVDNAEQRKSQGAQLAKLAEIAQQQELILRSMALRHEPAEMLFPPLRSTKEVQQALPKGHVLMSFLSTERNLYGFVYSRDRYEVWQIAAKPTLKKQVVALLRELGNYDQNHELTGTDFAKADWKKSAARVLDALLKKSKVDFSQPFDELTIVPDDFLWYLPFELLPTGRGDAAKPMLMQTHVRYAPTVGLAMPVASRAKPKPVVGVVVGKLHPRDDESVAKAAFEHFAEAVPGSVELTGPPPAATSLYRLQFDTLVVLDDIKPNDSGPYEWSPGQMDRGKPGSQLAAWLSLPFGGPRCVVLPGFHTHAENGLKKSQAAGSEMFLATCGLMASGTDTILISRWRTGGQISFDLMREFVQELPSVPPVDAWQRAVQVAAESTIDDDLEPRVKSLKGEAPKADFPFFWAGYLLVDSSAKADAGEPEQAQDEKAPDANLKAKAADPPAPAAKIEQVGDADAEAPTPEADEPGPADEPVGVGAAAKKAANRGKAPLRAKQPGSR